MDILVNSKGKLFFNNKEYLCVLGKNGVTNDKKEGDWATPVGCFSLREVFYRPDKIQRPKTKLPLSEIQKDDGWCDDVNLPQYNKKVKLPFNGSFENLWRDGDDLYDIVVVVGYNDDPAIPGKGSAIFIHVARPALTPTAGCLAFTRENLLEILKDCSQNTKICIER